MKKDADVLAAILQPSSVLLAEGWSCHGFPSVSCSCQHLREMFEELALRMTPVLRIWKRYVDDTFCVMEDTQTFLDHLNSLHPTIQFTMELEEDGHLPFLDTPLTRREDGGVNIGMYRKTHTNQYPQYTSHHPAHVKRGVASCLFHWARTVARGENIRREENHLDIVLKANGYPDHIIRLQQDQGRKENQKRHLSS